MLENVGRGLVYSETRMDAVDDDNAMPDEAFLGDPYVFWFHIDGPMLSWAGETHWLTWRERLRLFFRFATAETLAFEHWPRKWLYRVWLKGRTPTQEPVNE